MSIEELANKYYKWKLVHYGNPQHINHNNTIKDFKAGYEKAIAHLQPDNNDYAVKVIEERIKELEAERVNSIQDSNHEIVLFIRINDLKGILNNLQK